MENYHTKWSKSEYHLLKSYLFQRIFNTKFVKQNSSADDNPLEGRLRLI